MKILGKSVFLVILPHIFFQCRCRHFCPCLRGERQCSNTEAWSPPDGLIFSPFPLVCPRLSRQVFTPFEYGCVGYTEEAAIAKYGEENIETCPRWAVNPVAVVGRGRGEGFGHQRRAPTGHQRYLSVLPVACLGICGYELAGPDTPCPLSKEVH